MLSFKHEVFLEVARQLSFTKASQVLFISQPAISKHIQQLEDDYKTSLFERKGSSIVLSEAGNILVEHLTRAKAIERQLDYEISSYRDQLHVKGELKIGASTTVALYIIPSILSGFRNTHTEVRMSLLNRNSENVIKALLDHEIDLGIVEGKNKMTRINSEPFLTDEVIPVCSAKSYLGKKGKLLISDLKRVPVVLRETGSGTLAALKGTLASHHVKLSDLKITMRLGGTEALKNFVLADESLGFLPTRAVAKELAAGELVRIFIDGLTVIRQFYFVQRQGENDGLNNAFIKFAKSHYNIKL
ncbi:MAG TPA: LysR family transcriptional regulator [Cyclobacteriaceae bacterium]|nr:LysR family transcriptional regulator [Cyclobacteriaceae bacterium]